MKKKRKRMWRDERGQDLLELAIVMPLLFIILAGVFDLGRSMNNYIIITNAAREGARYASHWPGATFEDRIKQATIDEAAESGVALLPANIAVLGLNAAAGLPIEVRIERQFPFLMGSIIGMGEVTLRARAEMIVFGGD